MQIQNMNILFKYQKKIVLFNLVFQNKIVITLSQYFCSDYINKMLLSAYTQNFIVDILIDAII